MVRESPGEQGCRSEEGAGAASPRSSPPPGHQSRGTGRARRRGSDVCLVGRARPTQRDAPDDLQPRRSARPRSGRLGQGAPNSGSVVNSCLRACVAFSTSGIALTLSHQHSLLTPWRSLKEWRGGRGEVPAVLQICSWGPIQKIDPHRPQNGFPCTWGVRWDHPAPLPRRTPAAALRTVRGATAAQRSIYLTRLSRRNPEGSRLSRRGEAAHLDVALHLSSASMGQSVLDEPPR